MPWHTKFGHQIWLKRQSVGWQATPRRGPATAPKKGLPALQRRSGPARQDARTVRAGLCERPRAVGAVRQTRADPCVRWRAAGGRPSRVRGCVVPRLSFFSVSVLCTSPSQHAAARFDTLPTHHIYRGPKAALQTAPLPRRRPQRSTLEANSHAAQRSALDQSNRITRSASVGSKRLTHDGLHPVPSKKGTGDPREARL